MKEAGDLINNQYEVLRRLSGGMGYIDVVLDQVTRRHLAIKTLKDELVEDEGAMARFEREARNWINLSLEGHPNIVRAIAFHRGKDACRAWLSTRREAGFSIAIPPSCGFDGPHDRMLVEVGGYCRMDRRVQAISCGRRWPSHRTRPDQYPAETSK